MTPSAQAQAPTPPSADTQQHVAQARAAVVATMSNLLDAELQSRAGILHDNAAALDGQERDVVRATGLLRRERERLAREADLAARRAKELGNVQNWAEVLERGFLVLEETVRLARRGSGSGSCSCSECGCFDDGDGDGVCGLGAEGRCLPEEEGEEENDDDEDEEEDEGSVDVNVGLANGLHHGQSGFGDAGRRGS
ncbi:hypothetical protein E4U41_002560 [Claviceps citrina]|nr:hypothetical protein E4U41_002560 [Claviceps citrina]